MSLSRLRLREEYRTGEADLIGEFYCPCLSASIRYDRAVGYFRSSVFVLIGPQIIEFAKKGGKIKLISSPYLTQEDIEAISVGYSTKAERASIALQRDIEMLFEDKRTTKNTEALSTLISLGVIDLRIALLPSAKGEYHEKVGVFYDEAGESITFKGSINETWNGWHARGNYESFDVFCSWLDGRDRRQVERNISYFDRLWNGEIENIQVLDFPKIAKDKLKSISKDSLDEIECSEIVDYFSLGDKYRKKAIKEEKEAYKHRRTPLPHQLAAITAWESNGKRGILEHATGSGKTFTAITALKKHLDPDGIAIVLVPDKLLLRQWSDELKDEIENLVLLKAGDGNNRWRNNDRLRQFTSPEKGLGKRIVLSTVATARTTEFIIRVCSGDHLMMVVDEVHEIGSKESSNALKIKSGPRLGLSATPVRYGDPEGTQKIITYFGSIIEPPYTLENAIKDKRLVPYEYYPKAVNFTVEESADWSKATKDISKEYAKSKRDSNDNIVVTSRLKNLLIQRARIAKKAKAKVPLTLEIIREFYVDGQSWLIYCEDQHQLQLVMECLRSEGYAATEYHTSMSSDPDATLDWFRNFGGILVSIRCLDQGVDIPKISHAIILASSQNPRQFIQRRGRVLRVCEGKYSAAIFDAILVPVSLELEPQQLSLLKSEFQRSIQFSRMALNKSGANELMRIAIELGIDPDETGLFDGDGIEDIENDE